MGFFLVAKERKHKACLKKFEETRTFLIAKEKHKNYDGM